MMESLPPHDIEAEEAVLAAMLVDNELCPEMAALIGPGDFFREKNGWVFGAIQRIYDRDGAGAVNQITVAHELALDNRLEETGGQTYLGDIIRELPTAIGATYYAGIVRRMSTARKVIGVASNLIQRAYTPTDMQALLDMAVGRLMDLDAYEEKASKRIYTASEILAEGLADELMAWSENPGALAGYSTGYYLLDQLIGGIAWGRVTVILAETGVGKSKLVQSITEHIARLEDVLAFTTEMTRREWLARIAFAAGGLDKLSASKRGYLKPDEKERLFDGIERAEKLKLRIQDIGALSMATLVTDFRRAAALGVKVVAIDHLQAIKTPGISRAQEVEAVIDRIKSLAKDCHVGVLAVSHVNRQGSAKESSGIEQYADALIRLTPVDLFGEPLDRTGVAVSNRTHGGVKLKVSVEKNRHGAEGVCYLWLSWKDGGRILTADETGGAK